MHAPTVTQTAIRDKLAAGLIDVVQDCSAWRVRSTARRVHDDTDRSSASAAAFAKHRLHPRRVRPLGLLRRGSRPACAGRVRATFLLRHLDQLRRDAGRPHSRFATTGHQALGDRDVAALRAGGAHALLRRQHPHPGQRVLPGAGRRHRRSPDGAAQRPRRLDRPAVHHRLRAGRRTRGQSRPRNAARGLPPRRETPGPHQARPARHRLPPGPHRLPRRRGSLPRLGESPSAGG